MLISLNWLKDYIALDVSAEQLAHDMTLLGLEIESISRPGDEISDLLVGQIQSIDPHPDADKLVICQTDVGQDAPLQIVCGAKNMKVGDKVPTAVVGACLPGGFKIGRRKMRGVESQGMMCSASELGLSEASSGLMILDPTTPIGGDAKALLGLDDIIVEIEVTPNRGDWASMIGVARELAARYDKTLSIPEIQLTESSETAGSFSSVTIEDTALCPRYIGRILTNVNVGPSPQWLCQRLIAAGQRPINNIVDITNYVLLETGHPLHAFDYDRLAENRVVVRRAKAGESITTLDDEIRTLSDDMLVIADAQKAQAVAGVMGGADSEVWEGTTRILLESAYFLPASVRRTSRALGLISEASQHFQRGADPEMAEYAINRCAALIQELAGAEVASGLLDEYPKPIMPPEVELRYARCCALLGADIDAETQKRILQQLGFEILQTTDETCTVKVPTWRHDVTREADLIEEVARFYGYDTIEATLPKVRPGAKNFAPHSAIQRSLRGFLVGQGLTEVFNWTFCAVEDVQKAGLGPEFETMVTLDNPLSERYTSMRSSLIPGILANIAHNTHHGVNELAIFEMGPTFTPIEGQELPQQNLKLIIGLSGQAQAVHWSTETRPFDFFDAKGYVESIFDYIGLEPRFIGCDSGTFQEGQSAEIRLKKKTVGYIGKVSASVAKAYDLNQDVFLAELNLEVLFGVGRSYAQFQEIPAFPPSLRDMAVLVDQHVAGGDLVNLARQAGGKLLQSVRIFDIYTGERIPDHKKSVALGLVFQSNERTLTDKDTQKSWDKILKRLEKEFGAELR